MLCFKLLLFLSAVCVLVHGNKIDIDYYGSGLNRHVRVEMNCDLELHKQYCRYKCSKRHAACIDGNCYCLEGDTPGLLPAEKFHRPEDLPADTTSEENLYQKEYLNLNPEPQVPVSRPSLRHHIAHFCPDLDEARVCIRKCMPQGKPAFCGKDHVCYCGHILDSQNPVKTRPLDPNSMYAEFKDLYAKYFGTHEPEYEPNAENEGTIVEAKS
ncbi:hypothetical protein NE865_09534 [Phthorimaea operculella]|nr:hypothetical protein NE865_09534 [Phthorimaea operculella]